MSHEQVRSLISCPEDSRADQFSYADNTTICQDGTVCPHIGNDTCCHSRAGKKEILYHYAYPFPQIVNQLGSYYSLAGYGPPSSATSSTSPALTGSPSAGSALRPGSSNSASSAWSSSAKFVIGVGSGLGIALVACLAITFVRCSRKRNIPVHARSLSRESHRPVTAEELHGRSVPVEVGGELYEMHGST